MPNDAICYCLELFPGSVSLAERLLLELAEFFKRLTLVLFARPARIGVYPNPPHGTAEAAPASTICQRTQHGRKPEPAEQQAVKGAPRGSGQWGECVEAVIQTHQECNKNGSQKIPTWG